MSPGAAPKEHGQTSPKKPQGLKEDPPDQAKPKEATSKLAVMEQERVENAGLLQNDENQFDDADSMILTTQIRIRPIAIVVEPLHAMLREIANAFREASASVAAAAPPPLQETNLVCIEPFRGEEDEDTLEVKRTLLQWDNCDNQAADLNALAQYDIECVDSYAYNFKRLLCRVDPENHLPQPYVVRIFLGGLKPKIALWLSMANPRNLDEALVSAHKIEASGYYSERNGARAQN
ncbi:3136_t:CDS:2, partial [Gigaspora margarita]